MLDLDTSLVLHTAEVEYVRHMLRMLRTDISPESNIVDLSRFRSPRPFSSFDLICEVDTRGRDLGLEVRHRSTVCVSVGTISRCSRYGQQKEGLYVRQRRCSGITFGEPIGILGLRRYSSLTS